MKKYARVLPFLLAPLLLIPAGAAWVGGGDDDDDDDDEIELDEAEVFVEYNSTDEDFGIQFFWDGEPWKKMDVDGPDGNVMKLRLRNGVYEQGLAEGFFESAEPSIDELSMEEFFERFPEGEYEFEGRTVEGEDIEGETDFTHVLPAPPENLWPADGDMVDASMPLTATFDAVMLDVDGNWLEPELYELIVETEADILEVFTIVLPGDVRNPAVTVPPQFLKPGREYKLEIIVQEESGNRTISETEFETL